MVEIGLVYRTWLGTRRVRGSYPERFEELTAEQLTALIRIRKGIASPADEDRFLMAMTGLKKRAVKRMDIYHRYKLAELAEPLVKVKPYHEFIIKTIDGKYQHLHAPRPKMKGVTFSQFIFADTHCCNYAETGNVEELYRFVASLYLPKGDPFIEKHIEYNLRLVKKTDVDILEGIRVNYLHVREWIALAYPLIFVTATQEKNTQDSTETQERKTQDTRKEEGKARARNSGGWIKIFETLVGDDIVNMDRYADLPMHNVFRYLSARIKRNMKRK